MAKYQSILAAIFIVLMTSPALAVCDNANSQRAMKVCMAAEAKKSQRRLDLALKNARTRLRGDQTALKALNEATDAWQVFRDAECFRLADAYRGGSITPLITESCLHDLNQRRTQVLNQQRQDGALPNEDGWRGMLASNVFWHTKGRLKLDANCDGVMDTVVGGFRASAAEAEDRLEYILAISDGANKGNDPRFWTLELPIGTNAQKGLCGPVATLSLAEGATPQCPRVRIDDQRCDAVFVHIDPKTKKLVWFRN